MRAAAMVVAVLAASALVAPMRGLGAQPPDSLPALAEAADSAGRHADAVRLWTRFAPFAGGSPRLFWRRAQSRALAGDRAGAFADLGRAVGGGLVLDDSLRLAPALAGLRGDARWGPLVARARAVAPDRALRAELLALAERDQANPGRAALDSLARGGGPVPPAVFDSLGRALAAADAPVQARLRAIVDSAGWPGARRVGEDGAHAAWLVAQHAPDSTQARYLPLLAAAARRGEASGGDLAYFEDRVRVSAGRPQRFGTQLLLDSAGGGRPRLAPLADAACVDVWRRRLGLGPLAEYAAAFGVPWAPPAGAAAAAARVGRCAGPVP